MVFKYWIRFFFLVLKIDVWYCFKEIKGENSIFFKNVIICLMIFFCFKVKVFLINIILILIMWIRFLVEILVDKLVLYKEVNFFWNFCILGYLVFVVINIWVMSDLCVIVLLLKLFENWKVRWLVLNCWFLIKCREMFLIIFI